LFFISAGGCGDSSNTPVVYGTPTSSAGGSLRVNSDVENGWGIIIVYNNITSSAVTPYKQSACNFDGDLVFYDIPLNKLCRIEIFSCQVSYLNNPDSPLAARNVDYISSGQEVSLVSGTIEPAPSGTPVPPVNTPTPGSPT